MAKKLTPRADFILNAPTEAIAKRAWDAMIMASTHDPDHQKEINKLNKRVERLERLIEDLQRPEDV